ncbi:MAG: glycosyltransferase family 4 protein [Candidatus Methanoperedens sp.]|nr:glycosyltransferase family 4 protein [Candidatus Methanoperedens sp.]
MKLLVLQETDWIKRGPHQQHHLMDRMALRGHEVHVIDHEYLWKDDKERKMITGRKEIRGAYKIFKDADITLIRPGMIKISGLDHASILYFHNKEIKKQINEFKPDVIIAFGILNAYLGMRQAKKNNIPFVYYLIDHLHTLLPGAFKRSIAKQFEKATLRGADKILVISKGLKDYAVEMGGDINKLSVIPAGVDLERFNPQVDGSAIREKYGIKKDEILLFFMGWIYEFSGMKEVAESISTTNNEKIKLMIVGEGDLYEPLLKMRSEKNLDGRLILTGKVPFGDIPKYLAAADICLLPAYKNEIMMNIVPIKIYEYMAMGKPVIATALPGIQKEFGFDGGINYIENPGDALEKSMWLKKGNKIEDEGKKAYSYVNDLTWDSITDDFENILTGCVLSFNPVIEPRVAQWT